MLASLSDSTVKQYSTSLKLWWQFCSSRNIDPHKSSNDVVLSFIAEQFNHGASYGTLNNHRSAISLLLNSCIRDDERIKRLLKGAYKLRPPTPRYSSTWDPQLVLSYIARWVPHSEIPIIQLTKKLAMLLALCTAHRVQTLSLIKEEQINIHSTGIKIVISSLIKTSGPGREPPVLFLPFFRENLNICPATTLKDYIFKTKELRGHNSNLFLTCKRPIRNATAQTISKWIKGVLSDSGVDTSRFRAHSTRHASTSAASAAGVSLDIIRKTAGWSSTSNVFAKFYNRPIIDESEFARSVCLTTRD